MRMATPWNKTMNLLDGKLPVQENEVLVSREYLEQIGKNGRAWNTTKLQQPGWSN